MPTIADLTPDPRNPRKHNPRNIAMIADLLQRVGAARSIVIDEDDVILAGNGVVEAAAQVGIERVRVVEADGDELIAVKRRGLTPEQKADLKTGDNRSAELAEWDAPVALGLIDDGLIEAADYWYDDEEAALRRLADEDASPVTADENYSRSVESPVYTVTGERPPVGSLVDTTRTDALIAAIDATNLDDDLKRFLRHAAYRHLHFDYAKVAEFYAHADARVQDLMERSALVIIDVDKAIEYGFARLVGDLNAIAADTYDD